MAAIDDDDEESRPTYRLGCNVLITLKTSKKFFPMHAHGIIYAINLKF